jgi:hypothetical protein
MRSIRTAVSLTALVLAPFVASGLSFAQQLPPQDQKVSPEVRQERRQKMRERLEQLKKSDPQKYRQIMQKAREKRHERLEKL